MEKTKMDLEEQFAKFLMKKPVAGANVWVAPGAVVAGDVTIGECSSVWFNAVIRGDFNRITVGHHTNIQDSALLHISDQHPCVVGNYVTIGHSARVHACTVGDGALIGMGSTVLDGAVVGDQALVGANSLVPMGMRIPAGWLAFGNPAKLIRELTPDEKAVIHGYAEKYVKAAEAYRTGRAGML